LAREVAGSTAQFFDLENSVDRLALASAPERTLAALRGLVVLDEVQTLPKLLPVLRVLADRPGNPARFLIPGSASPDLVHGASESLHSPPLAAGISRANQNQEHADIH
jgi:hypothetical protein